ncbi:hypothetical protein O7553_24365 [Solwaraspora sp. WMMA2059]|uniref:hypothetical protein n=1 Tax=Solwaraspora sp. WMMA2059 TaxID=3015160 RepID=UPI00248B8296|nr:hypothetical protein [Solwaraspora sp. WMMA2059]WBB96413.1 hypothetical protein O7553_24365 [Solwaraspora sp. WMMA2059]
MGSWTGSPTRWSDGSGVGPDADRADAGWGARDEPVSGPHWADPPSRYAEVLPFTRTPRGGSVTRGSRSADNGRATAVNGRPVSGPAETVVPTPRPAPAGESIQPGGVDTGRADNEPTARMAGGPADDPTPPGGSAERRGGDNPRPTPTPVNPPPRWQETARVVPTAPLRAVPVASAAPVSPARPARPGTPPGFQPPPTGQPGAQRSEPDDRPVEPDRQRSAQSDLPPDRPDLPPDRSGMSPDQSGLPGTPADRSAAGPAGRTADAAGRDEPARRDDFAPTPPQPAGQPSNVGPLRQPTGERPGPGAGGPWSRQVTGEWPRPGTADELRRPVPTSAAPAADQWHRQSATGEWPRPTSSAAWDRPADDVPGDRTQRGQGSPSGPASGPPAGEPDWSYGQRWPAPEPGWTDGPTDSSWAATDSGGQVWAAEAAGGPSGPVERDDAEPSGWSDDRTAPADSGWSGPPPPSWGGDDRSGWPGAASGESGWAMPDPPTVPEELPWRPDRPADLGQAAGYRPVSGQPRYEPTAPAEQYEPTAPAGGQYGPGRPGQGDSGGDADGLMPRRRAVSRRADDELGEATVSGPTGASVPAEPPGAPATAEPAGGALPPVEHPADLSTTPIAAAALDSLPQRVPADPDVPTVPQQLPPVEHAAETPELARIASHLRRGDVVDQPQERPEGFDVGAILAAVRGVGGVRDASLRTTDAGAHSLRLDLSEGADPAEVSRLVARLLQERMGLAAAPQNLPGGEPDHGLPALPGRADLPAPGRPPGSTAPPLTAPGGVPGWVAPEPADVPRRRRQPLGPRPGQDDPPPRHAGAGATAATSAVPCVEPGGTAPESGPPRPLNPGGRPGPRVVLDHVQVSTFGVDATVEVRLTAGQRTTSGVATGPAVDGYVLRLCAVAAASSIEKLLTGPAGAADRGRCIVEHAAVVPMGGCEVAVVVVLLACGGWVEQLAGSAVVSGDPRQAVVRATLAAVNRRLDALLA